MKNLLMMVNKGTLVEWKFIQVKNDLTGVGSPLVISKKLKPELHILNIFMIINFLPYFSKICPGHFFLTVGSYCVSSVQFL